MERRLVIALGIRKSGFFLEIPIVRIEIAQQLCCEQIQGKTTVPLSMQ